MFDGHGGKQAAAFASKHILPELQQQLASIAAHPDFKLTEELEEYQEQLPDGATAVWQAQDVFAQALPNALVQTFRHTQNKFHEHTKVNMRGGVCSSSHADPHLG